MNTLTIKLEMTDWTFLFIFTEKLSGLFLAGFKVIQK